MKKLLIIIHILLSLIIHLHAQPELKYAEASIIGNDAQWIDSYPVGDSVLLHYMVYSANIEIKRAVWVRKNGDSKPIELDTEIFSVNRYGGDVYYYVLEEIKKKLVLKAIVDRSDDTRFEPEESIAIQGDVLDEFIDKNQFIILHDRKNKKIVEMELNRMQVVNTREWDLPDAIYKQIDKTPFTFVKDGSFSNSFSGHAKVKLYRERDGRYVITVDERHSVRSNKPVTAEKTTGTHIAIMGDTVVNIVPYTANNEFRSWYADGKLFRYSLSRQSSNLEIIDVASKDTIAKQIFGNNVNFPIYRRDGTKKSVDIDNKFPELTKLAGRTDPLIAVTADPDGGYLLMTGSRQMTSDQTGVTVAVMFGVTGYLIFTIAGGMKHAGNTPGTDLYYYNIFDPASGSLEVIPIEKNNSVRDYVDRYEAEHISNQRRIVLRGYSENTNDVIGFYYNEGPEKVNVVWFPRK